MLKTILIWLVAGAVVLLIFFWLLGGGIGKMIQDGRMFSFSISSLFNGGLSITSLSLPWAPTIYPAIPNPAQQGGTSVPVSGESAGAEPTPVSNSFGTPSPYAGEVQIVEATALSQDPNSQYLILQAGSLASPLDLSGWSLQSALSGDRGFISEGASPFFSGRVNTVAGVKLGSGGIAYIVTGASPVGVSFQDNRCEGYLGTLQRFVPPLSQACTPPWTLIPDSPGNEQALGKSCFQYIDSLLACTFPGNPPSYLSQACVSAIQNALSYNGCVQASQNEVGFEENSWRVYLAQGAPLWSSQHDVIRLLDNEGRIVSSLSY